MINSVQLEIFKSLFHAIAEEDVVRIMQSPYTMVASDGDIPLFGEAAPHPRSYGTFARVLGVYVREKHVIPLEEAVRKMSGYPAERLKIFDRGILRPGMKADVVVQADHRVLHRNAAEAGPVLVHEVAPLPVDTADLDPVGRHALDLLLDPDEPDLLVVEYKYDDRQVLPPRGLQIRDRHQ